LYSKIFNVGLDFLYFPTGQGRIRYYAAPYFEFGIYNYTYYRYIPYDGSYYVPSYDYYKGQRLAGGIKNGLLFQPTRHFSISTDFGFGIKKDETSRINETIESHFKANLIIGYRF